MYNVSNCLYNVANEVMQNRALQWEVGRYATLPFFILPCIIRKDKFWCAGYLVQDATMNYLATKLRTDLSINQKTNQFVTEMFTRSSIIPLGWALVSFYNSNWKLSFVYFASSRAVVLVRDLLYPNAPSNLFHQKVLDCLDVESPSGK